MKIYGFPLSPFVRKVLVAAQEKGLEAELVPTNPMQPDDGVPRRQPVPQDPGDRRRRFHARRFDRDRGLSRRQVPRARAAPGRARGARQGGLVRGSGRHRADARRRRRWCSTASCARASSAATATRRRRWRPRRRSSRPLGYLEGVVGDDGWLDGEFSLGDIAVASVFRTLGYAGWQLDAAAYPQLAGVVRPGHARAPAGRRRRRIEDRDLRRGAAAASRPSRAGRTSRRSVGERAVACRSRARPRAPIRRAASCRRTARRAPSASARGTPRRARASRRARSAARRPRAGRRSSRRRSRSRP